MMGKNGFFPATFILLLISLFTRAQEVPFQRGVNLTGWFQAGSAQQIQFSRYTKRDFEQIQSLGCDVIRLPINLHYMTSGAPNYIVDPLFYDFLDQVIDWSEALEMHLILDNHTFDPAESTDPQVGEVLKKVWPQVAERYRSRSEYLYYEVLNEPHGIADDVWNQIQGEVIQAIREVDTKHTIIVGPANWNSYNNLDDLLYYNDYNEIYTFHFYDPFIFTHQGATWVSPSMQPLSQVPFPYQSEQMPDFPSSLNGTWVALNFNNYAVEGQVEVVQSLIDIAARFKQERQVPVFCGEFGVYIPNSDDSSRVFWYETVQQELEKHDIPWTIWDYHGGFGLYEAGGNGLFDHDLHVPLLQALDFTVPPQSEYQLLPDSTGFSLYTDFAGEQIFLSANSDGDVNYYSEDEPNNEKYAFYWRGATQYNTISFDFVPNKDLSQLVAEDYALNFIIRGTDPDLKFDIRWVDTNAGEADLPWRMGVTIDEISVPFDRYWHSLHIPLKSFSEQGAWDGEWYPPEGKFDWTAVDRLEIVAERQDFGSAQLWFDNLHLTNQDTSQIFVTDAFTDVITSLSAAKSRAGLKIYPNPTERILKVRTDSPDRQRISQLIGASGKVVRKAEFVGSLELDLSGLPVGMYYLRITDENRLTSTHKIILK